MSMHLNERGPNVNTIRIGSQVTSTTTTYPGFYLRKHSRIKNAYYVDGAAISKDNTNHVAVQLQDNAGSPVPYAAVNTSDTAAVAATPLSMALSSTADSDADEEDVPAGTMLNAKVQTFGTALTTNAVLVVEWYPL